MDGPLGVPPPEEAPYENTAATVDEERDWYTTCLWEDMNEALAAPTSVTYSLACPSALLTAPMSFEEEPLSQLQLPHVILDRDAPVRGAPGHWHHPNTVDISRPLRLPRNVRNMAEWGSAVITFGGKHKGRPYRVVMMEDPDYFRWMQYGLQGGMLGPIMEDFVAYVQAFHRLAMEARREAARAAHAAAPQSIPQSTLPMPKAKDLLCPPKAEAKQAEKPQ